MARRGLFVICVAFIVVLLCGIPAFAAFKDVPDPSLNTKINLLVEKNIVNGFGDGTFRPSAPITRAQMAKMIAIAKAFPTSSSSAADASFRDVPPGHWAAQYINASAHAGIVKGYADGSFRPNQEITRAELARMLRRTIEVKQIVAAKPSFTDVARTYWAFNEVETVFHYQLMGGYKDGGFHPADPATRSQIAVAVYKMINNTYPKTDQVEQDIQEPVIPKPVTEATITAANDGKTIICIDAGHGGKDSGAVAKSNGLKEKDVNLAVALKIQSLLGKSVDKVVMTRSTDVFVELSERAQIANKSNADLFVSIHHNSFSTDTAVGTAVYSFPGSKVGAELAKIIQNELVKAFGWDNVAGKDDGARTANYAVLRQTTMTAALCESAYLSNPGEAAMLATDGFRQKEATAIYSGIIKYLDQNGQ